MKPLTCTRCGFPLERSSCGTGVCARCLARSFREQLGEAGEGEAAPPRSFGGYRLIREIGRGGMGVVYRAEQVSLDRVVALKLLLGGAYSSETMLSRFRMEAAAAAALQHPNIVPVYDYGEWEGYPYYAMELVAGRDLSTICAGRPLETRRAAEIVRDLAAAVHYAHSKAILHRDLKPSNVMVDETGRPRITDFGLARRLDGSGEATVTGVMLGSPSYASPEQAGGRGGQVGIQSDVYGLGALLYHLLTGRAPFNAPTPTETLKLVIETEPVRPRLLNPTLPRDIETICLKCLLKEPGARYASALAVSEDIERFIEQRPIRARPPSVAYRTRKLVRRRWPSLCVGLVISVLVAIGATAWVRNVRATAAARVRRGQIEQIFDRTLQVADPGFSRGRNATLRDLLEETARWVPIEFADDPLLEAGIHAKIGETYCKLSLFNDAASHLEFAWATRKRLLPEENPGYLQSLRDLGVLRMWEMRYEESEEHLYRVLRIQERVLGRDSEQVLRTRDDIGVCRTVQLDLNLRHGTEREKYVEECIRFNEESYDLARRRFGDEHPLTLTHEANLADASLLRGTQAAKEEAVRISEHNYPTCVRVLGPEHPISLSSMVNHGRALLAVGRDEEALRILQQDLPMAERALGPDHQVTAWTMQQLEQALRRAGRTQEAYNLVPRYVIAWTRTYGPSHIHNQAFCFWRLHGLTTHDNAAALSVRCAEDLLREYRERLRLPSNHRAIGMLELVLADACLAQKLLPDAERHLRDAREIMLHQPPGLGPTAWQLWMLYHEVGEYQRVEKQFTSAEVAFLTAYEGLNVPGVWAPAYRVQSSVLRSLVELYTDWGKPEKAAEWTRKREAFAQAHPEVTPWD